MKERPIIMGADSVRAILDGLKTQTRRVVNSRIFIEIDNGNDPPIFQDSPNFGEALMKYGRYPYGYIGDRLWVRETWAEATPYPSSAVYKATYEYPQDFTHDWKSPIYMPRWASRIILEITDIRVERVQDITEEDALEEGIMSNEEYEARASEDNLFPCPRCKGYQVHETFGYDYGITEVDCTYCDTPKKRYRIVWDSLNAKRGYSWESNPWVWVISFKRIK